MQNDQPTLSFTGSRNVISGGVAIIAVTSAVGQTSSLTMLNADFEIHYSGAISVGGTGGTIATASILAEVAGLTLEISLDGYVASANGQIDLTSTAKFAGTLDVIFENGFQPIVDKHI